MDENIIKLDGYILLLNKSKKQFFKLVLSIIQYDFITNIIMIN